MSADDIDAVFSVLADATRRRLLGDLAAGGPLTATQLAPGYGVSRQAVAKHLGALESAGLLERHRHGREVRYRVVDGRLQGATAWLDDVGRRWDRRLEMLGEVLRSGH